ncbi:MAG: 2-octaprenyl-6-methoxyphenol hydroxylase [Gammaproteobacteria bacterium]|jgi:2-octaprenyl-6-methoxyphenol hydroxylase
MQKEYDIAIVGGGLVGASLACSLAHSDFRVAVLEQYSLGAERQPSYDERGLALSLSSCRILDAIHVWSFLANKAIPIRHIHISDRGKFGSVRLHAADLQINAMGYVVKAREIGEVILEKLSKIENVDYLCPQKISEIKISSDHVNIKLDDTIKLESISCKLLVAADGSNSCIRENLSINTQTKDYGQVAIVSNISMDRDHNDTAYERFTSTGPLALLPMSQSRFVSIFCVKRDQLSEYMTMDEDDYIKVLQEISGKRAGKIIKLGTKQSYELKLIRAEHQYKERVLLLGNAAHTIHPNGAQGFNLGLRDVAALAELILKLPPDCQDPGNTQLLKDYVNLRKHNQDKVIDFTDALASLFYTDDYFRMIVRNFGMCVLDMFPILKNNFVKHAMGLKGQQPGLVRGLRLDQL